MVDYNATTQGGTGTLAVFFSDGTSKTLQSTHPFYAEALTYLVATPVAEHDEEHVRELVNPALRISRSLAEVDPKFSTDLYTLSYDGLPLRSELADLIVQGLNSRTDDWERYARFLASLERNPSFGAKQGLYSWIKNKGLTILPDGRFVAHKGVDHDGLSKHAGPNNFVNGVLIGKPGVPMRVPHYVGTVVSKRRGDVDDSTEACSTGLHVGTLRYATDFAPRLVTVAVWPEDVVGGDQGFKIRVARYEVLELNDSKSEFSGHNYEIRDRSEEVSAAEAQHAEQAGVNHFDVEFGSDEERIEFNGLCSDGRRLYSVLRVQFAKTHDAAYAQALGSHGTYQEYLARQEAERAEQARQEAAERAAAEDEAPEPGPKAQALLQAAEGQRPLVEPTEGTGLFGRKVLRDWAEVNPGLKSDLEDRLPNGDFRLGNTAVARIYEAITTEASVRRYRKAL